MQNMLLIICISLVMHILHIHVLQVSDERDFNELLRQLQKPFCLSHRAPCDP